MNGRRRSRAQALALVGAGIAGAALPVRAGAQTVPLRAGAVAADTFGEAYYAADMGFFKAAGFDAEVTTFPNGAAMAAACAGGSIDVGAGEATELANGIARGLPFLIIAGGALYSSDAPTTLLCVQKTGPYRQAKDLEGQAIAVISLVSLNATAVKAWLVQNGADLGRVRFIELPPAEMPGALARGVVAAANFGEPVLTAAAADILPIGKPYDAVAKQFLISDWFTTRDWLARNPDAARRLVAVIYQTARWANEHRDLSAALLAKYTKMDLDRIRGMRRTAFATSLDRRLIQPVLDVAARYKQLPREFNADELIARL